MKVVLFCGGLGSRMRHGAGDPPKPLTPILGKPIVEHLVEYFAQFGVREAILTLGHFADQIEDWAQRRGPVAGCRLTPHWTGLHATIGDRLLACRELLDGEETFYATYADGVCDADLAAHRNAFLASEAGASFLAVRPSHLSLDAVTFDAAGRVTGIAPLAKRAWVNGGFFCLRQDIFDVLNPGEEIVHEGFARLRGQGRLACRRHDGFWRCVDTPKDRDVLERLCADGFPWMREAARQVAA